MCLMTRRGSLTYYLAAVVVGCFFASAGFFLVGQLPRWHGGAVRASGLREFFFLYFFSIPFGGFAALLFAFLLRRLASLIRTRRLLAWACIGAALAPALIWAASGLLEGLRTYGGSSPTVSRLMLPLIWVSFGAELLRPFWWVMIPVGFATALVLFAIHRAFEPKGETAN